MEAKKVMAIAVDDNALLPDVRVPAGRNLDDDRALTDKQLRQEQHRYTKAAAAADLPAALAAERAAEQALAAASPSRKAAKTAELAKARAAVQVAAEHDPGQAAGLAEIRDYLRDLLWRRRLDSDPEYRAQVMRRRQRILNDPDLNPWLKQQYLDTRIVDNKQLADLFGIGEQQVWNLAAPLMKERRPRPHPRMSPDPDVVLTIIGARKGPGTQLGVALEWWRQATRGQFVAEANEMVKNPNRGRYGRRRTAPRERPRGRQTKKKPTP